MNKRCFIIQRFDGAHYDGLYEQTFKSAIEAAGFDPYRVDQDPSASIPIESIEGKISSADACFAELSEDAPNIWFEVGYSIAKEKPLCLVCSKKRTKFPFDIQHRQIIPYPEQLLPNDYAELGKRITARLKSISANDVALQQNAEVARALSIGSSVSGLPSHEFMTLTIIFTSTFTGDITPKSLEQEMERSGYIAIAAGLAVAGLKQKLFIESAQTADSYGDEYKILKVTPKGELWLVEHQNELNLKLDNSTQKLIPEYSDTGITDEDIPF